MSSCTRVKYLYTVGDFLPAAVKNSKKDVCNSDYLPKGFKDNIHNKYNFKFYKCHVNVDGLEELVLVPDSSYCLESELASAETRNIDVYAGLQNISPEVDIMSYRIYSYSQVNDSIIGPITAYYGLLDEDHQVYCQDKYIFIPNLDQNKFEGKSKNKFKHEKVRLYFSINTRIDTLDIPRNTGQKEVKSSLEVVTIKDRAYNKFGGDRGVYYHVKDFLPSLTLTQSDTIEVELLNMEN